MHDNMNDTVTITIDRATAEALWKSAPLAIRDGNGGPYTSQLYNQLCIALGKNVPSSN